MHQQLAIPPMPAGAAALGAWWDEAAAQAACAFFPTYLRHTEGEWAGRPFRLADWQRDRIIRPMFGWKRADGTRLYRTAWIEIPRKNGKTELAAGVALLMLLGDGEMGGQVYSLATDKDQAKLVFNKAGVMIGFSEELLKHCEVLKTSIFCPQLAAGFRPLSSGPSGKHGLSPTGAIGDEVHEWPDGELADVVHKGTAARRQPLEVYITTAGLAEQGYAWEMHELAEAILKGDLEDPTMLIVIYAADADADWTTEEAWRQANPNFGISVKPDYMRAEAEKARRSPLAENEFRRYHLNQWLGQVTRWLPMHHWSVCTDAPGDRHRWRSLFEEMRGRKCYAGLDLAISRDLTAWCMMFPPKEEGGRTVFLWRFWLPRATVEGQPARRRARYEAFAAAGALQLTEGDAVDYALIEKQIVEDGEAYSIEWLGIDRYNATDLSIRLMNSHGLPVQYFRQGFISMNSPSREFERMVVVHQIEHGNHPVATWMAENVAIEGPDAAGTIKPTKAGRGESAPKIDGIVAAIMAKGGEMTTPVQPVSFWQIA